MQRSSAVVRWTECTFWAGISDKRDAICTQVGTDNENDSSVHRRIANESNTSSFPIYEGDPFSASILKKKKQRKDLFIFNKSLSQSEH